MRRVVVTGLGAVTPCGVSVDETWSNVVAGRSGIGTITGFDAENFASRIGGECTGFDAEKYIEKKRLREGARFVHLAIAAADEAVNAAGLADAPVDKDRVGTYIGVGMCGLELLEATANTLFTKGPRRITPYFIPSVIANMAPGQVSMRFGFRGPNFTTTSACSSGAHAIGEAYRAIARGEVDAAVAGGSEAAVTGLGVGGFAAMKALSTRNDAPELASRPFDRGRDGFVIAEGAGLMILESLDAAKQRGAKILGEVVGYGATSDAYHLTQPAPEGEGAARAMRQALADGKLNASDVDYVNAHATSTPTGDIQELAAMRSVFGSRVAEGLVVSSTKSMMGHLLGAAGGVEAVLTLLALRDGVAPPTINLDDPEESAKGFNLVPNKAQEHGFKVGMSNSFGFGGTNATLIVKRFDA